MSFRSGRWFVSFSAEIDRNEPPPGDPDGAVGVDLGIKSLAVLSTGEVIFESASSGAGVEGVGRLQRQASRRTGPDTGRTPSKRWIKTQARITKLHGQIARARLDGLHKLTTRLVREFGTIVVEESCAARVNEPDGNPGKPTTRGHGYRHGKAPAHAGRGQRQSGNALTR